MSQIAHTLHSLVPISQFSKGQAAQVFDRLRTEKQLIVLKNNAPAAVLLSPEEYERMTEMEENYGLLLMAQERLKNNALNQAIPQEQVSKALEHPISAGSAAGFGASGQIGPAEGA